MYLSIKFRCRCLSIKNPNRWVSGAEGFVARCSLKLRLTQGGGVAPYQ